MAATDARPIPLKNTAFRVYFGILDADGDLVTGAAGLDSERSLDGGTFADCTSEATEVATSSGIYYLDLTAAEMNTDCTVVIVKTSTSGAKTTILTFYPQETGDILADLTDTQVQEVARLTHGATNVYFVRKDGSDSNDGLSPGGAKLTIGSAQTAAASGAIVRVGPGTYTETALQDDGVTYQLAPGAIISGGTADCITLASGITVRVEGDGKVITTGSDAAAFTITHASAVLVVDVDAIEADGQALNQTNGKATITARRISGGAITTDALDCSGGIQIVNAKEIVGTGPNTLHMNGTGQQCITADRISGTSILCSGTSTGEQVVTVGELTTSGNSCECVLGEQTIRAGHIHSSIGVCVEASGGMQSVTCNSASAEGNYIVECSGANLTFETGEAYCNSSACIYVTGGVAKIKGNFRNADAGNVVVEQTGGTCIIRDSYLAGNITVSGGTLRLLNCVVTGTVTQSGSGAITADGGTKLLGSVTGTVTWQSDRSIDSSGNALPTAAQITTAILAGTVDGITLSSAMELILASLSGEAQPHVTQYVTLTSATGGTFTLTYKGQTTSALAYNASAATVQTALQALSTIGSGNATVSGSAGGPYTITMGGTLDLDALAKMTATSSLTGSSPTIAVDTTVRYFKRDGTTVKSTIRYPSTDAARTGSTINS